MPAEPFDTGDRLGVYLLPRVEAYGSFGCAITFAVAEGYREEAMFAHGLCLKHGPPSEAELVAPIYVSDAYESVDPQFAIKALHEFAMICCEQHEMFRESEF
jgi:hypothetical protein